MRDRSAWLDAVRCVRSRLSADATLTVENVASAGRVPLQLPSAQDTAGDLFGDRRRAIRIIGDPSPDLMHPIAAACSLARRPHRVAPLVVTGPFALSRSWMH